MVLLQARYAGFGGLAASNLMSRSDKRHYQVFWMLSRTVALHFADAAEATRRRLIGECQKIRV